MAIGLSFQKVYFPFLYVRKFLMKRKIFLCLISLLPIVPVFAQTEKDTAFMSAAIRQTFRIYQNAMGNQAKIFNGSKYNPPKHTIEAHPFFISEDWLTGDVFYDGENFQDVFLMYDLLSGQLVTEHTASGQAIQLVWAKVDHFTIAGHHFQKITPESVGGTLPETDFYDILYSGDIRIVARRFKYMREKIVGAVIERTFPQKDRYFLFKNGVFFPVRSKGSILKLMSDKKQEMRKFLKQHKVSFAQNRETLLIKLAEHYDSL
jgi:hypothetical protein